MTEHLAKLAPTTPARWARRFADVGSEHEVASLLSEVAKDYGLAGYLLINVPSSTSTEISAHVLMTTWPAEMLKDYDRDGLILGSPVIHRLRRSTNPFAYEADSTNSSRPDGKAQLAIRLFGRYGMPRGAYFPAHNPLGRRGALSFGGDRAALTHMEMAELNGIANLAFTKVTDFRPDDRVAASLSRREVECLSWASAGKTSVEISGILGLSEYTVNHYLNRATRKLDAVNRVQAVVKAIRAGLLN
ncbi:helix-turn-helix transcriptional regulator [Mycoplana dimorpha]|uniref:DNA-binding CsgD family transcriptional regulator n=1 Tax=Mycoplana dimorpha TaxID=28320 RepID=A0A2T5BHD7_MYCDI|nr:LuxR family transcriptional regulator [Mycoplana dimorpha]PTM98409.1 DNA-binding CsgD family transcriptional regulator [Mycoplana dimorpha]